MILTEYIVVGTGNEDVHEPNNVEDEEEEEEIDEEVFDAYNLIWCYCLMHSLSVFVF